MEEQEVYSPISMPPALDTFRRANQDLRPVAGTPLSQCPTNLDMGTFLGKAMMFKAQGASQMNVTPEAPLRFRARHWAMIPDSRVSEKTGEIREFVSVVLFDIDGRCFKSSGVASPFRLLALLQLYSEGEWMEGIPILVRAIPKPGRAPMHSIEIDLHG